MTIKSGRLDHTITVQRMTVTVGLGGTQAETWTTLATIKAERLKASFDERAAAWGDNARQLVTWRIRYLAGLLPSDRFLVGTVAHDIKSIEPIGRNRELIVVTEQQK